MKTFHEFQFHTGETDQAGVNRSTQVRLTVYGELPRLFEGKYVCRNCSPLVFALFIFYILCVQHRYFPHLKILIKQLIK